MKDFDVVNGWMNCKGDVGDERPRRCRPDEKERLFLTFDLHLHIDGWVFYIFVAERHFVRRERRFATRAVRLNLVSLVDQPSIVVLLQRPPDRLDVIVLERDVRMIQVDPVAHHAGQLFPVGFVLPDRLFALLVELGNTVFHDVILVLETEFFLDFYLHRQTVCIPTRFAMHLKATHGFVTTD